MSILDVKEMTKDKCLMTKEIRMTKSCCPSQFVIRALSFFSHRIASRSSPLGLSGDCGEGAAIGTRGACAPQKKNYAASSSSWRGIPRNSKRRIKVSSIKLFGQEAPAVMPTTIGPRGSQFFAMTSRFSCRL